jgi:GGDEF domain-containing protein
VRSAFETSSHTFGRHGFGSTVSVGIAITDSSDLSALLNAADQALYRAKMLGRSFQSTLTTDLVGPQSANGIHVTALCRMNFQKYIIFSNYCGPATLC